MDIPGRHIERNEKKMRKNGLWKMRMVIAPALAAACLLTGCGGQDGGEGSGAGSVSQTEEGGDQLAKILDLVGFDVEVARKVAEKLGVEVEFMEAEWDSLFAAMDSGRIDTVINEVEYSDERALKYDFSQPYTYIRGALMVKGDNEDISSFEDLDGKKAAQNLTSSWGTMAEEYGAELVSVDAVSQCVDLLLSGRADATLNVETAFADYLKSHPDADVKIVARTDSASSSSRIPVKKGNEELLEAIDKAIDELRESGELAELSEKYFGMDVTKE